MKDIFNVYSVRNVEVTKDTDDNTDKVNPNKRTSQMDSISTLHGINKEKYNDIWKFGVGQKLLDRLDESRKILFTYALKTKFYVKTGDIVNLVTTQVLQPE